MGLGDHHLECIEPRVRAAVARPASRRRLKCACVPVRDEDARATCELPDARGQAQSAAVQM